MADPVPATAPIVAAPVVPGEPSSSPWGAFLSSPTFRRILYALVGVLLPIVNARFGWNIPTEQVIGAMTVLLGLITSSTINQAHARSVEAGAAAGAAAGAGAVGAP